MKAGRELDALVAEKVMGYKAAPIPDGETLNPPNFWLVAEDGDTILTHINAGLVPHYSTDIAAAWQVMDYMLEQHDQQLFLRFAYAVRFAPEGDLVARGYTAAYRICLAALRAVGVEL